ncbi:hypothetical protein ACN27F_08905 [Solwaraspora sp. WMMB335]|uniref:hypothetical protein n=1 Tax=Solwaraspora sp. WMMB335 TaxID=3404118 RepID=UPI003B964C9B
MSTPTLPDISVPEVLAGAYAHGPGKAVQPGAAPPYPHRAGPATPLGAALAGYGERGTRLRQVLTAALAPRRFEPWNPFNDHRAYPSPRAAHLVDVALWLGGRRWAVDPVRGLLRAIAATGSVGADGPPTADWAMVELAGHPHRMPSGYGRLAEALAVLEAGHVAGALTEAAAGYGLTATSRTAAAGLTVSFGGSTPPTWPRRRLRAVRSSGLGPCGFGADPRPLPGAVLTDLVDAAYRIPAGSPGAWPGLRHTVAVGNVTGREPGWYRAEPGGPVAAAAPAAALDQLQRAYTYPRSQTDVAGLPLAWLITADIAAAVRAGGAEAYPRLLYAAGACAQHLATAAGAAGLFCRPVRAVREVVVEAAATVPAGHDLVYLLLIGRSRVRDFAYDLDDPEVPL